MDYYEQLAARPSYQDSLKVLEADIQHANMLAASIPRSKGGTFLQMKLVYTQLAPIFLFLLQWIDCSSSCLLASYLNLFDIVIYKVSSDGRPNISSYGRKATTSQFYNVILPSLQRLHGDSLDVDITQEEDLKMIVKKRYEGKIKLSDIDLEREKECGICLELCTKMVLPNCCHAMCINCYRDWNTRSESCPFCRGSIKRVDSGDLWVLTCGSDVVDTQTVIKEDMLRFYLFINNLPTDIPDALFLMYYEYLI
ncbi:E3 ubiquitin-protein ligase AIRP2-like [Argentina anserina]|uniref:E3 ubiquitin-protein ligase AIRP2-like n=1 Tax=Argentina anserina TaxID=57926 RepID=UPI00217628F8|nr:E3 ubiquitin-protein ligase AIRP2-like [Potentilla anserina]